MFASRNQKSKIILPLLMLIMGEMMKTTEGGRDRPRCEKPDYIQNGSYRMRRDRVMRITCKPGFQLQGPKTIECVRGKWEGEKPVCAKRGCKNNLVQPENGRIQIESDVKAILYCSENYNLAGNRHSYCNGTHWDRPIGNCREHKNVVQHACDFETDDICGWTYEPREGLEWKRVMAANVFTSFKTGPRHDHTTMTANGGHYMLMESLTRVDDLVVLTSPIYDRSLTLKTACCFQFYYFMYGAGVGELFVVIKPVSLSPNELFQKRKDFIKFEKNGNQNNIWNEAHFNIEELDEDFQILFVAKAGHGQLSDIAVDDVRLLTGDDCKAFDKKDDEESSNEEYISTTYESIYDMQSCAGRCFDHQGVGIIKDSGHLRGLCSCEIECEDNETCCPDYRMVCLKELFAESTANTFYGAETTKLQEPRSSTPITIKTTISTTPTTVKRTPTTLKTTPTTITTSARTTMRTTTTMRTKPTTVKTTLRTTPTTVKTTPITKTTPTTIKTTQITKTTPTTVKTTTTMKTTSTTKTKTTTKSIRTTPSTTTFKPTTQKTTSTSTTKATPTTTKSTTVTSTTPTSPTTKPPNITTTLAAYKAPTPTSAQKPMEYIINNKPNPEIPHRGSNLLFYLFIMTVACVLAGTAYRRFGSKAVAWYMIHFKRNNRGDEDSTSITTSFKRSTPNDSNAMENAKASRIKKTKKPSFSKNGMKAPLIDDNDDEEGSDMGINGNIALKSNIFTEL